MNSPPEPGQTIDTVADKPVPPDLLVKVAGPEDAEAIRELFLRVFGEEMPNDHWRWKYLRALSRAVVVYRGNTMVAHYGGVGSKILLENKESMAIQITDLMVDPAYRHAVRSRSPFWLSARKFLKSYVGYNNPFLLAYGFPSDRAMGLSEKLGFFAPAGRMWEVSWKVVPVELPETMSAGDKVISIDKGNYIRYEGRINKLWNQFSRLFGDDIICLKDSEYFRWRYLEHPAKQYSMYLVMGGFFNKPKALLVMRHDKWNEGPGTTSGKSMLMDVLAPSLDFASVLAMAQGIAFDNDSGQVQTWCSNSFTHVFAGSNAAQKPLPIVIPACTGSPGPAPESQKDKWWFMPGDTDYL